MIKRKHFILTLIFYMAVLVFPEHARSALRLFGSSEKISSELTPFVKWTGVLARDAHHRNTMLRQCQAGGRCLYDDWMDIVASVRGQPFETMLEKVNRQINSSPYILDIVNWGLEDYWETPYEFLIRDGDCEDYAIVKYMTLKALGVAPDSMRIVVLQDNNLNLLHSVLAVHEQGRTHILDNQIQQVVLDSAIHHYSPIYSINERHWWRHLPD